jgi:anaerobic ribonucleoside-triphosphate reductase
MTLCNQMVNFLGIMQNEWAGAQAFSGFDTYLAPFVKVDNLSYKEVKQVHSIVHLWRQYPVSLGHSGSVHQHHVGLDRP